MCVDLSLRERVSCIARFGVMDARTLSIEISDLSATKFSDGSLAEGRSLDAATCELILPSMTVSSTNCRACGVSFQFPHGISI